MTKIAIIGAGGYEFPLQLMNDFLSFESTQDAHYALMDIDPQSLAPDGAAGATLGRRARPAREDRADHRSHHRAGRRGLRRRLLPGGGPGRVRRRHGGPTALRRGPDRR